jgi:hypothetical protein
LKELIAEIKEETKMMQYDKYGKPKYRRVCKACRKKLLSA